MSRILLIFHVGISLVGIATGFVVLYGMLTQQALPVWTAIFLATTVLTSVTGFPLPAEKFLPSHAFGIVSLIVLPVAIYAYYGQNLAGSWRWIYVVSAMFAQYLNVFVLVVQMFQKIPSIRRFAPTQREAPFAVAQIAVLAFFVAVTILVAMKF